MIKLFGTYADECNGALNDVELYYNCRVFQYGNGRDITWMNGIGELITINDGDVILQCGNGSWFAHFKPLIN